MATNQQIQNAKGTVSKGFNEFKKKFGGNIGVASKAWGKLKKTASESPKSTNVVKPTTPSKPKATPAAPPAQAAGGALSKVTQGAIQGLASFSGQTLPGVPGVNNDPSLIFATGNPELDNFMNNIWLPLLEAEFATDPSAVLSDELFNNIADRVEKSFGPQFAEQLKLAEEAFDVSKAGLEASEQKTQRSLDLTLGRAGEDAATKKARTIEDARIGKERIQRNFQESLAESQAALANRGLTFGGTRKKEEGRLERAKSESLSDLERAKGRTLTDVGTQLGRLQSDVPFEKGFQSGVFGRSLSSLGSAFGQEKKKIAGEKTLQIASEKAKLQALGGTLLSNPQFFPNQ